MLALLACSSPAPAPAPAEAVVAPERGADAVSPAEDYAAQRASWVPALTRKGPAPGGGKPVTAPVGVVPLAFPSPVGELPGYLMLPGADGASMPVVVFAHPGEHLDPALFDEVRPLLQMGVGVYLPTRRGANGNPGHYQAWAGEVDDLAAAVTFLAGRREVDRRSISVAGQGSGGQLAALLALRGDLPVRFTAGVGALYRTEDLLRMRDRLPFDVGSSVEVSMRLLYPHLGSLRVPHVAFVGEDDLASGKSVAAFEEEGRRRSARFRVERVRGDEHTALQPALARLAVMVRDGDAGLFPR